MEEINEDAVRAAIRDTDPQLEALSLLLKSVAGDAVTVLSSTLRMMGHNPAEMPGEIFLQSILIEADRAFQPISREKWISIHDTYMQIKSIVESNPGLQQELKAHKEGVGERLSRAADALGTDGPIAGLLDGDF